jgi:hypothetical protein
VDGDIESAADDSVVIFLTGCFYDWFSLSHCELIFGAFLIGLLRFDFRMIGRVAARYQISRFAFEFGQNSKLLIVNGLLL